MQKFEHKINGAFHNHQSVGKLMPTFMFNVSPAESYAGQIDIHSMSAPTSASTLNRIFLDHYVFYVPYRLVWDQFTDFITQRQTGQNEDDSVPTQVPMLKGTNATDPDEFMDMGWIWAKQKLFADPTTPTEYGISALPTWVYYNIYNQIFRLQNTDSLDYPTDRGVLLDARYRNNDFFLKAATMDSQDETTFSTNIDSLRAAFASDRFNKNRDYYGDKYTDYLRANGVQVNSSVIEEPELVASSSHSYRYNLISNVTKTATEPLGEKGGYYEVKGTTSIKGRKFFPEHGLLIGISVVKPEAPYASYSHPVHFDFDYRQYFSDEFQMRSEANFTSSMGTLWQENDATSLAPADLEIPQYLSLKSGLNLTSAELTEDNTVHDYYYNRQSLAHSLTSDEVRSAITVPTAAQFDNMFDTTGEIGAFGFGAQLAVPKLIKSSPLIKAGKTKRL